MIKKELLTPEQRFGTIWDYLMSGLMILGVLSCIAVCVLICIELFNQTKYDTIPALILLTLGMNFVWIKLCMFVDRVVRRYWLRSYVIDENDPNVVKLLGSVRFLDVELAKRRLLSVRSNYQIVPNSYELYGCTMAAVPASKEYLAARAELKGIGIEI